MVKLAALLVLSLCQALPTRVEDKNNLVILMVDGGRHDYFSRMDKVDVPAFSTIAAEGVVSQYVQPILPSSSFQSWTTIVTGLNPEQHGLIGNYIYDRDSKEEFRLDKVGLEGDNSNNSIWWTDHIPLWTTTTVKGLKTSLHHWSRCDVPFKVDGKDVMPEKCTPYSEINGYNDTTVTLESAFDEVITDIKDNAYKVAFVYYPNVDNTGHTSGPDSNELKDEIKAVDKVINSFLHKLQTAGLKDNTNFVIVSDHGMSSNSQKKFEKITQYADPNSMERIVFDGAVCNIAVKQGKLEEVYSGLQKWESMDVYKKNNTPAYLGYKDHKLILDILVVSKGPVKIGQDNANADLYLPETKRSEDEATQQKGGSHGFNDKSDGYESEGSYPDVRGIFMAIGPAFKQGYNQSWIKLVDEYQVFTHVLDIEGENNMGNWDRVKGMFSVEENPDNGVEYLVRTNILLLLASLVVSSACII